MIIVEKIDRIIVIDLLYLGDLLFAHPFFAGLRKLFPKTRIDLVANSNFAEIMRSNSNLDHVYSYNKNWNTTRSYKFAKKLKMNNYQLGLNIHGNWRTALLLKLIAADKNIGYGGQGRGLFLDQEIEKSNASHVIEFYLDFLEQLKDSELLIPNLNEQQKKMNLTESAYPVLDFEKSYHKKAENKLKEIGLENDFLVLNTGGSWNSKRWPEEYFAEIADLLAAQKHKILFVGGSADKERVAYICNKIENQKQIYNLSGKTSLLELAAILKKAKLVISGDTGPIHVAAAVGTNTFTIFGPSDEEKYAPRGKGQNILIKNIDLNCRPCGEHECPLGHFKCMRELTPDLVVKRLKEEELI
ncbi:lipopolysaccharide heptosyltransferase II [Halanaerobium praevalens]|uniref:lipopolysaccharide heptosyltransferase II n=1 Tax=Halanaerobium praevalens TaxID=2331 RepID=UPI001FDEF188|nr:lipopolysaccharide heptosyltransferase II [Halanaerobium praevalens]